MPGSCAHELLFLSSRCFASSRGRGTLLAAAGVALLVLLRVIIIDTLVWSDNSARSASGHWSGARQDSADLVRQIARKVQAASHEPYNLTRADVEDFSQNGQSCYIARLFQPQSEGRTFLEAGAYNGEDLSNTLHLERDLGWTGLLVEPDPWSFWALTKRERKARLLQACLSPTTSASMMTLKQSGAMSRLRRPEEVGQRGIFAEVPCYPLYAVMQATRLTTLDYLVLDLEGLEMLVLQTVPWDMVNITVVQVEASHLDPTKAGRSSSRYKFTKSLRQSLPRPSRTPPTRQRTLFEPPADHDRLVRSDHDDVLRSKGMTHQRRQVVEDTSATDCARRTVETTLPKMEDLSPGQKELVLFMAKHQYEFNAAIGEDFIFMKSSIR